MVTDLDLIMKPIDSIPTKGSPGYAPIARRVLHEMLSAGDGKAMLVASSVSRNPLESLARQLRRAQADIKVRVTILDRDPDTMKGTNFGLYAQLADPF